MLKMVLVAAYLLGMAHLAWAQQKPEPTVCGLGVPMSESCQKEFELWQKAEAEWRKWKAKFGSLAIYQNQRLPYVPRPIPPWWLKARCESGPFGLAYVAEEACQKYREALRYDWLAHYVGPVEQISFTARTPQIRGEELTFLEWLLQNLHFDTIWTDSTNKARSYGFLGNHVTIGRIGRVSVWGAPGFIALWEPTGDVSVKWTYGFDLYLFRFHLPFNEKEVPIYLTFAKVFENWQSVDIIRNPQAGRDMIGISFTIR